MIEIKIPAIEYFDEDKNEFIETKETVLLLEHSLVSISLWESKWKVPFLSKTNKTVEEASHYIKCMTLNKVEDSVYDNIPNKAFAEINNYIEDSMTATWFNERPSGGGRGELVTSELIYYWMVALNIPFECQHWHLNRLMTLVKICNIKNSPPKKMGRKDLINNNRLLNEARKGNRNG